MSRIHRGTPRNLARLARLLRAGELVAVPTETVYGLAANALDAPACRQIFAAKGRPAHDPLIVHLHSLAQLADVAEPNADALKLARKFWPGPLTLVLPKKPAVPDIVTAGLPSVAVRIPSHPLFRRLLKLAGVPLAAPSANPFGYVSPTTAQHVQSGLGRKIRHILDGGPCAIGLESTILDLRDPRGPRLLRPGAVTKSEIERVLGRKIRGPKKRAARGVAQLAPGMLARHYSPRTPITLHRRRISRAAVEQGTDRAAWVFLAKPQGVAGKNIFWLDPHGALPGVARRLFHLLRRLDEKGFARLHVELASGGGLADAINDRLLRAAATVDGT
ncbi:MAG: Sua5/YciO/YrdC/YwlC family protein [Verrucomicrobia bacterium]|nr:Sua5/YciO/YrdC/YwlC family protein [Verrucomicrobiota bacterium]